MGKGKQWTLAEDTALAEAWVAVAESALPGSEEKGDTYWGTVHDKWVAKMNGSRRTVQALKNHWASIQRVVRKFGGYVQELTDASGSHTDAAASIPKAQALQRYAVAEGETFELVSVWEILQKSAKWHGSKTPGSALKRSRSREIVFEGGSVLKPEKRLLLSVVSSGAPAGTVSAIDRRLSLPEPSNGTPANTSSTSEKRLSLPATSNGVVSVATTAVAEVASIPEIAPAPTAYSESVERLAESQRENNEVLADQMLQTLILANAPGSKPLPEKDQYAASITKLAEAQREKNELIADQMLMTMLLADAADSANRKALEQLKEKYLKRAFQKTNEQQAGVPPTAATTSVINANEAAI